MARAGCVVTLGGYGEVGEESLAFGDVTTSTPDQCFEGVVKDNRLAAGRAP